MLSTSIRLLNLKLNRIISHQLYHSHTVYLRMKHISSERKLFFRSHITFSGWVNAPYLHSFGISLLPLLLQQFLVGICFCELQNAVESCANQENTRFANELWRSHLDAFSAILPSVSFPWASTEIHCFGGSRTTSKCWQAKPFCRIHCSGGTSVCQETGEFPSRPACCTFWTALTILP